MVLDAGADLPVVEVDGMSLTTEQISVVAHRQASVSLAASGRRRAAASHEFAERMAAHRPLYGRSTGVGANRTVSVAAEPVAGEPGAGEPGAHARMLLRSHATAVGSSRSPDRVRGMLLIRLNQLAAGGSGVHPRIADAVLSMLRLDALPDIPDSGGIGTGDLQALARTALALMGEGSTAGPLATPIAFGAADGLGFLSSNAATLADAALAVRDIAEAADAALAIAALTFSAVAGNAEAYAAGAGRTTPFPGAMTVCAAMRALIGCDRYGTRWNSSGGVVPAARIQDPFALRALPQVHGPVLDQLAVAASVVERMGNAPAENPILLPDPEEPDGGLVAHHAGFFATYLQMAMDSLALAVAQSGQLVLGRLALLVEPSFTGLPPFLADGTPGASGVMMCEYQAASALGSIRGSAMPAGLQTVTLSRGVEEDASYASLAAAQCLRIAEHYRQLLACELVAAVRARRMQGGTVPAGSEKEVLTACATLPAGWTDRDMSPDLAQAVSLLPVLAALVRSGGFSRS